jgi:hypothetical protein
MQTTITPLRGKFINEAIPGRHGGIAERLYLPGIATLSLVMTMWLNKESGRKPLFLDYHLYLLQSYFTV